jgi:hypothetical protein
MDDHVENVENEEELTFWAQHRFLLLIASSIVIAFVLVVVSLVMYYTSGASQLDLSRPGYKSVSDQIVDRSDGGAEYSAFGPINSASIEEFKKLFDAQASSATTVDAFGSDPLNPDVLEFGQAQE